MLEQKLLAIASIPLGLFLIWIALRSFRSGVTAGRSTSNVYTREDQPGWFYFFCWARVLIGTLAIVVGAVYLNRLFG